MQELPPNPPEYSPDQQKNGVIASLFFWATVFLLAFATVALTVVGSLRSTDPSLPQLDFVHYEGKQSAYSNRLNKRD